MPVSDEIFVPLSVIYQAHSEAALQEKFLIKNRKQIKVLVDSMWEQTVEFLFSVKARNYTEALRIINLRKSELTSEDDLMVIESLASVLRDYDVLIIKNYIDISAKLAPFVLVSLRRLCLSLTLHETHRQNNRAIALRNVVSGIR